MSNTSNTGQLHIPAPCLEAREAVALELAGGPAPSAPVRAHATSCRDCVAAIARIEEVWSVPTDAFPRPSLTPAQLDALLEGTLARAKQPEAAPAQVLPLRSAGRPEHRSNVVRAAALLAIAASIVGIAWYAKPPAPPAEELAQASPTPVIPKGPVGVRLADAKGEISFVPLDGSVVPEPKKGDALPPGLFAASRGAALAIEGAGTLAVRGDATVLIGGTEKEPVVTIARGEIFVDLPKGTIRSFYVHTPTGQVRVTGTQFGVKVGPKATNVEVTEGTVEVTSPEGTTKVTAGQAVDLKGGAVPALVSPADPSRDSRGWLREIAPHLAPPAAMAVKTTKTVPDGSIGGSHEEEVVEEAGLPKESVANAMERRMDAMRRCYEIARRSNLDLEVRAMISFVIDEDGRAEQVRISELPESQAALGLCLMNETKQAVFPGAAKGTKVTVNYPVLFVPKAD